MMLPFRPGLLIHILFPEVRQRVGLTVKQARVAADSGYYRALEIPEVNDPGERAALRRLVEERNLKLIYWLSFPQFDSSFSISAPDENIRRRAVQELTPHLAYAAETGAYAVGILPGRDVGPELRPRAMESLKKSILELAKAGRTYGISRFHMETMDREAHKKHVLGPTDEALIFIEDIRRQVPEFFLAFDTSHLRLLGEDPIDSLRKAASVIGQIHLANCVPDPGHPRYGDHHMPLGSPGFLDRNYIARLFAAGLEAGVLGPDAPVVSLEVAGPGGDASLPVEREGRIMMQDIFAEMGWKV